MSFSIPVRAIGTSEKLGDRAALRKTTTGWEFATEEAFEDFIWANLDQMFGLTPFARQFYVQGQYCDLLAVDRNKQLTVIELKVTEDRYIIQQLTRYYDALQQEQPHPDRIDYQRPIQLIAIQPSFHKDNLIDIKYHTLSFQLFQFEIIQDNKEFSLNVTDYNTQKNKHYHIPYREIDYTKSNSELSPTPQLLLDWLGSHSKTESDNILKIREQILNFDSRMQESIEGTSRDQFIKYGRGKSKPCAELIFAKKEKIIVVFLYLNIPNRKPRGRGRMQLIPQESYEVVTEIIHVRQGIARTRKAYNSWTFTSTSSGEPIAYTMESMVEVALLIWRDRF